MRWLHGLNALRVCLLIASFPAILPYLRAQDQPSAPNRDQLQSHCTASGLYQAWLHEDVRYIITDQERADFRKLTTDDQRDKFVEDFWSRRNPTPESSESPYKEEHYRRIAYANTRFAADVPGWKTDRGRFYIMWGPPESVDAKPGLAPPTETWHYLFIDGLGQNVFLTFKDDCVCGKYHLSEADSDSRFPRIFNPLWK
jgi:GWxTD domain-containing protein